jgi:hypothetical protein
MDSLIHVGLHKTGTTTLQSFCHRHSQQLKASGVLYPSTGLQGSQHALIPASLLESHPLLSLDATRNDRLFFLDPLRAELQQFSPRLTIISSEVFSEVIQQQEACLELVHALSGLFERTTILLTVREGSQLALSALKHMQREQFGGAIVNPVGTYLQLVDFQSNVTRFWRNSGLHVIEKNMEDSSGNLVAHYLADLVGLYSAEAQQLLISLGGDAADDSIMANADELPAFVYLVLFLLANAPEAGAYPQLPLLATVLEECQPELSGSRAAPAVEPAHLRGYLDFFSSRLVDHPEFHRGIGTDLKWQVLAQLGIDASSSASLLALVNRVRSRLGLP